MSKKICAVFIDGPNIIRGQFDEWEQGSEFLLQNQINWQYVGDEIMKALSREGFEHKIKDIEFARAYLAKGGKKFDSMFFESILDPYHNAERALKNSGFKLLYQYNKDVDGLMRSDILKFTKSIENESGTPVVVVASGDAGFIPVLRKFKQRTGGKVIVVGWDNCINRSYNKFADEIIVLDGFPLKSEVF